MSRKRKERSETEYLRGRIKELESENKQLKKTAGRSNKRAKRLETLLDHHAPSDEITEQDFHLLTPRCPECQDKLDVIDLNVRELHKCMNERCNYSKFYPKSKR